MAKKDEQKQESQEKAPETMAGQSPDQEAEEQAKLGFDGAAREALAVQKGRFRAQGAGVKEDDLISEVDAKEHGYFGYSPTGPGENDAPWNRSEASRLGTQGEFGEDS